MLLTLPPRPRVPRIPDSRPLLTREILFFGGKGGVGKTTLAASYALMAAERGWRALLVSTDPAHSTGDVLGAEIGPEPRRICEHLWALEIDPAHEADRYIADVKGRIMDAVPPRLVAEVERQIEIARVTPGAEESALFERFTRIMEEVGRRYDRLLFDTAPLGHTLRLLSLPESMATWMSGLIARRKKVNVLGRMWRTVAGASEREGGHDDDSVVTALEERVRRFRAARALMTDPDRTAFVFVMVPERLPIAETARATETLERCGIPIGAVVVNRVLPRCVAGHFLERRQGLETAYLREIDDRFARYPRFRVPLFERDVYGREALGQVVEALPRSERGVGR